MPCFFASRAPSMEQTTKRAAHCAALGAVAMTLFLSAAAGAGLPERKVLRGFNIIASPGHPFGSASAQRSLAAARQAGANAVALVPFFWQATASSSDITRGNDMSDEELAAAIRQAHALGLYVLVKPQVWIAQSWAGEVAPATPEAWRAWFANYQRELLRVARIAAETRAEALALGTELTKTVGHDEWRDMIVAARKIFPGSLLYVAHNAEEAQSVPFWDALDEIGVSLYPPLRDDRAGRIAAMRDSADRLDALSARYGKPVLVAEIGLRSAEGAAAKPWESAEERVAAVDLRVQAQVISDWLAVLDRPSIGGVLIWRWFSDPAAGGPRDTDFTVQGKPAEAILRCAWAASCAAR